MSAAVASVTLPDPIAPRAADYPIQGFLYQFNKTIAALLAGQDGAEVVVEGIIEDIDIHEPQTTTAVQCKYHEGQETFKLSIIYKPLLQMMLHFHKNAASNILYRLFAYFPDRPSGECLSITRADLETVLQSKDKALAKYVNELAEFVDIDGFLARLTIEFGPCFDALVKQISEALTACGFQADDIATVIYPNALNIIADLSIKHDPALRKIGKAHLIATLQNVKTTAISRWTLALKNQAAILGARRKQLKQSLSRNVRRRNFLVSSSEISDFDDDIVVFISEYIDKYHFKAAHTEPPTFCLDCDIEAFEDIQQRLYAKGVKFTTGFIGSRFDRSFFARAPIVVPARDRPEREFSVRLARFDTDRFALNMPKCHDFFLITSKQYSELDLKDVNEERLAVDNLRQVKYVLGVTDSYE